MQTVESESLFEKGTWTPAELKAYFIVDCSLPVWYYREIISIPELNINDASTQLQPQEHSATAGPSQALSLTHFRNNTLQCVAESDLSLTCGQGFKATIPTTDPSGLRDAKGENWTNGFLKEEIGFAQGPVLLEKCLLVKKRGYVHLCEQHTTQRNGLGVCMRKCEGPLIEDAKEWPRNPVSKKLQDNTQLAVQSHPVVPSYDCSAQHADRLKLQIRGLLKVIITDGQTACLSRCFRFVSSSHDRISGSVLEVTVKPGDNITLQCDCKRSLGVYIVWYRNCSHENQPSLVLEMFDASRKYKKNSAYLNLLPRFHFVNNNSSDSYDLLIMNVTGSDEGLYYCGTERTTVVEEDKIIKRKIYTYGNITRLLLNSGSSHSCPAVSVGSWLMSWMMMLTPGFTLLSLFLSFLLVYHLNQKTAKNVPQTILDTCSQTRWNQDDDKCLTRVVFQVQHGQTHQ
ncbi:hypothetical protein PAMA_016330 [Pampus argenteus]